MSTIALLGASGFTGALLAAELAARGHDVVAAGRDPARVRDAVASVSASVVAVRSVDAQDPISLREALGGAEAAVSAIGPFSRHGRAVVDAAIDVGVHHVDVAGEPEYVRWVHDERDSAARNAGIAVVPGAGFLGLLGDLLANLAADAVQDPSEVHVTYLMVGGWRVPGGLSGGSRRSLATMVGQPGIALRGGERSTEWPGEARRLAWFPRPVGPSHAAGIPGSEAVTVPRHVPGVREVVTYLAVPGWQAELLQFGASAARWEPVRGRAARWLERRTSNPSPTRRAGSRWACVAESKGSNGVARAWAYGHDQYGLSAAAAVAVVEAVLDGAVDAGVLPPALAAESSTLLDRLSERTGLRWSVVRPEP